MKKQADEEKAPQSDAQEDVDQIIKTAKALGVEVDETDVAQWLTAMAASGTMEWDVDRSAVWKGSTPFNQTVPVRLVIGVGSNPHFWRGPFLTRGCGVGWRERGSKLPDKKPKRLHLPLLERLNTSHTH